MEEPAAKYDPEVLTSAADEIRKEAKLWRNRIWFADWLQELAVIQNAANEAEARRHAADVEAARLQAEFAERIATAERAASERQADADSQIRQKQNTIDLLERQVAQLRGEHGRVSEQLAATSAERARVEEVHRQFLAKVGAR